jgi:hypothetical protein
MCLFNHENVRYSDIAEHKIHPFATSIFQIFINIPFATSPNIILPEQNKEPPSKQQRNTRRAFPGTIRKGVLPF